MLIRTAMDTITNKRNIKYLVKLGVKHRNSLRQALGSRLGLNLWLSSNKGGMEVVKVMMECGIELNSLSRSGTMEVLPETSARMVDLLLLMSFIGKS